MSTNKTTMTGFKYFSLVALALLSFSFAVMATTNPVGASKEDQLRAETEQLEQEIAEKEAYLTSLQEQANTLRTKIDSLQAEIETANKQIDLTQVNIESLELEIEKTQTELDRQSGILKETLRTLYKEGDVTTIELLASSDSYGDFIDQQEYLNRLKDGIHESAEKVEALKLELEDEKAKQDDLLAKLEAQRTDLSSKQSEQKAILDQTEGEESRYQSILADLQAQKDQAEQALNAYLASLIGNAVSLGPVSAGDVIGTIGMTGYTTGPHVHYKMYTASTIGPGVDPIGTINQLGWLWPVGGGGGVITQYWGCSGLGGIYPIYNGCYWHDAVDVAAPQGTPLLAPADGDIIHRGCLYTGTIYSNYMVIIDHGNGYYSVYAHLTAPEDPAFDACRANTYYN